MTKNFCSNSFGQRFARKRKKITLKQNHRTRNLSILVDSQTCRNIVINIKIPSPMKIKMYIKISRSCFSASQIEKTFCFVKQKSDSRFSFNVFSYGDDFAENNTKRRLNSLVKKHFEQIEYSSIEISFYLRYKCKKDNR